MIGEYNDDKMGIFMTMITFNCNLIHSFHFFNPSIIPWTQNLWEVPSNKLFDLVNWMGGSFIIDWWIINKKQNK